MKRRNETGNDPIDFVTAARRLTARWHEQVELFPLMRDEIPLALYIKANVRHVMREGLLARYDH